MDAPQRPIEEVCTALQGVAAMSHFAAEQLDALARLCDWRTFEAGDCICSEDDLGYDVFLVLSGELEAQRQTPFGMPQRVGILRAGDLFGEISLLDSQPRSSTIVAIGGGELLCVNGVRLSEFAGDDVQFQVSLLRTFWHSLSRKIREANDAMIELMAPGTQVSPLEARAPGEKVNLDSEHGAQILRRQGLTDDELALLQTYLQAHRFEPGQHVFSEGEEGDCFFIVTDGAVRISRRVPGLGEEALAILREGEMFGEMALIDDRPRSADAVAHTEGSTVVAVSKEQLSEVLQMKPETAVRFLKLLCQILSRRIRAMNDLLVAWRTMTGFTG